MFEQPAALPHSDFSTRGAFLHLSEAFPNQEQHFEDKDFDMLKLVMIPLSTHLCRIIYLFLFYHQCLESFSRAK